MNGKQPNLSALGTAEKGLERRKSLAGVKLRTAAIKVTRENQTTAQRGTGGIKMIFANDKYDGIDVITEKEAIYVLPRIVGKDRMPGFGNGHLGVAALPFTASQVEGVLAGPLKEKVLAIAGTRFFGFYKSSVSWDGFRQRMGFHIRWCSGVPVEHPSFKLEKSERREQFVSLIWEALSILEGETTLKKRVRQVRDALNKCKNPDVIEQVATLLNV